MNKKLNFALCATAAVFAVLMLIVSCTQKKDRLVSDTLTIAITPQSVSVSTGAAKTLTATCKSAYSNNPDISPQWTVDSPSLGTFSPKSGKTTTFTATNSVMAVGTGKIYATYSNVNASANVSVSSSSVNSIYGTITISPASISLSTGATQSYTAICRNSNGAVVSAAPQWAVALPTLGTFSPTTGLSTTFKATSQTGYAGSGTIYATCAGFNNATAAVSVTSNTVSGPSGGGSAITLYSDSGLYSVTGHIPNIDSWGGTASASTSNPGLAAQTSGGVTGVQNSYMLDASIPLNTYFGWGITLDKNNSSYGLNMSAYASGHIKFYLMTDRALAGGEEIYVNVKDSGGNACTNIVIGPSYGWTNTVIGSWAPISVPVSAITGASISSINLPFIIDIHNLSGSSPITMSVDYVQWTTN